MAKILNMDDFRNMTSNITSFSHAYLFNSNSLELSYPYIKDFAKMIILGQNYDLANEVVATISYQIDNDEFDDLYIVNPNTISINTEEINKLMTYMDKKSLRPNGKRVYIIYGFERLSQDVSNKILKFLEEPNENIYALLMTENIEKILPTIISRCQIINLTVEKKEDDLEKISHMQKFLKNLIQENKKMIAYEYEYFGDDFMNRSKFYEDFEILEKVISITINKHHTLNNDDREIYVCEELLNYQDGQLVKILDITNRLKCLIKNNINLNLLLDRYIIEITEELGLCKKS